MSGYKKKFYVVWKGRKPGVYDNWEDALEQVDDFPGAQFKSYTSAQEASVAFRKAASTDRDDLANLLSGVSARSIPADGKPDYMQFPEIDLRGWAVDASCLGNPGTMEYQGVDLLSGKVIFRVGPFEKATNNIGEFLAIVHALALMHQRGERHTIYSDSKTGMAWVRNKNIKTQLKPVPENRKTFEMMARALEWLRTHQIDTKILKWQTEIWGEIPADFGRK